MSARIKAAKLLIKTGRFIQSAAVAVMRPHDLIEFSRQYYLKQDNVQGWSDAQLVNSGLNTLERSLLNKTGANQGRLLLLGVGGGREAIPLAKHGFEVTGVDFIPQMVKKAEENARKNGVGIVGMVQEISRLDLPENAYDITWLSAAMYSCVPTRKKRVEMLKRIHKALRPGGYFIFGFIWDPRADSSARSVFLKKQIARLALGNLRIEKGDMLRFNLEFIHAFTSLEELKTEIVLGGFELIEMQANDESEFAGAIARKSG